jgi:hypothetical protein
MYFCKKIRRMTANLLAYEEVANFIAELDPRKLLTLKPSAIVQNRVETLLFQKKENGLTTEEQHELDRYLALEQLISLAKIHARKHLKAA